MGFSIARTKDGGEVLIIGILAGTAAAVIKISLTRGNRRAIHEKILTTGIHMPHHPQQQERSSHTAPKNAFLGNVFFYE